MSQGVQDTLQMDTLVVQKGRRDDLAGGDWMSNPPHHILCDRIWCLARILQVNLFPSFFFFGGWTHFSSLPFLDQNQSLIISLLICGNINLKWGGMEFEWNQLCYLSRRSLTVPPSIERHATLLILAQHPDHLINLLECMATELPRLYFVSFSINCLPFFLP